MTDLWMVCRLHILRNVHLYAPYALLLAVLGLHSTRVPYGVRTWHCYQRHVCENALHTQSSQVGHIRIRGSKFEPEGICGPLLSLVSLLGMPKQCERLVGLWVVVHCCRSMGKGAKICLQCSVQGGFGMTPWCDDLVCSWRRLLADRHSLPFPWTLSLHRRWCPSASHHPLTFLFLLALTFPLPSPFPSLGLSLRRPPCPSASPHSFPSLSLGRLCQRSPRTCPVSLLCVESAQRKSSQVGHIRIRGSKFEPEGICGPLLSLVSLLGMPKQCERLVGLWVVVHCCRSMGKGAKICLQCSVQGGGGGEFLF